MAQHVGDKSVILSHGLAVQKRVQRLRCHLVGDLWAQGAMY